MKIKIALCLLAAALLPACTTTRTASNTRTTNDYTDAKGVRHAMNVAEETTSTVEPPPPAMGPTELERNPALIPTPLLRASAASGP